MNINSLNERVLAYRIINCRGDKAFKWIAHSWLKKVTGAKAITGLTIFEYFGLVDSNANIINVPCDCPMYPKDSKRFKIIIQLIYLKLKMDS